MEEIKKNNEKNFEIFKNLPFILTLSYNSNIFENNDDPLFKLMNIFYNNTKEKFVEEILKLKEQEILKILYFNRKDINNILEELDKYIPISIKDNNDDNTTSNLYNYFYISLLLEENKYMINYFHDINLINKIDIDIKKINDNNIDNRLKKIILSKIILDLINNYRVEDIYRERQEETLYILEEEYKEYITNNIYIVKELGLNENNFLKMRIDKIYTEIIKKLIEKEKLGFSNIPQELDFERIYLTKYMNDELLKFINSNDNYKKYIEKFSILNKNDLFNDENKINFYYNLIKYIFKDSIYIYKIPFLLKTKKILTKVLKDKSNILKQQSFNDKIQYIIKKISDSNYYSNQYINSKNKEEEDRTFITIDGTSSFINNLSVSKAHNIKDFEKEGDSNLDTIKFIINEDEEKKVEEILNESIFIFKENEYQKIKYDNFK